MNPRFHIWNGWDVVSVFWILLALVTLAFLPTGITNFRGEDRIVFLILLLCSFLLFLLAGFGRRVRFIAHLEKHPRPFDAPD